ncbi:MAG: response regulator [Proteobacteria bacterium]|nr:response regulator [Pseudomonadota bacterium]
MSQDPSNHHLNILLVENSRTARALLTRLLRDEGYQVDCVSSGLEAIEAILHSNYHLVIMDVFLPQLNGYEAATQIRSLNSHKSNIPLIAFTSSTDEKDKRTCLDAGMNEYIIKTTDNKALLETLLKYKKEIFPTQNNISN